MKIRALRLYIRRNYEEWLAIALCVIVFGVVAWLFANNMARLVATTNW